MENLSNTIGNKDDHDEKNVTWENNHQKIIGAINKAMHYFDSPPPTITEISQSTGLSRKTIYEHLNEYSSHPAYLKRSKMFEALQFEVMMQLCHSAMRGSHKSARLYLELIGKIKPRGITSTNDNVQINGMVLNQQIIQSLSPEQLKIIEDIIKPTASIHELSLLKSEEEVKG